MDIWIQAYGTVVAGGALIGVALVALILLTGRAMSPSGMLGSLRDGREGIAAAAITFLAGVLIAPSIMKAVGSTPPPPPETTLALLAVGGLLIGIGARLGQSSVLGCIGGLAKLSGTSGITALAIIAGAALSPFIYLALNTVGVS